MPKPHLTTNRDRLSKRYKALHRKLAAEVYIEKLRPAAEVAQSKLPEPDRLSQIRKICADTTLNIEKHAELLDKTQRRKQRSAEYRQRGSLD